jgi:hypothetical protein
MTDVSSSTPAPLPEETTHTFSRSGSGCCLKCRYALPPLVDVAPIFFQNGFVACEKCGESVNLWQATLAVAQSMPVLSWSISSLGATNTNFLKQVETGVIYTIDLTEYGAGKDARILSINYTGQGGPDGAVSAVEWHGNTPVRRFMGTAVRYLGVPLGEGKLPRAGKVAISVTWIRGEESDAWPYLMGAFEAASAGDYSPALVFAQSAVEISMMPLIAKRLELRVAATRVKDFMNGDLTYGHALNIILPYFCGELGVRDMPAEVRGSLNKLRKQRNEIIHRGVKSSSIPTSDVAEAMAAAAFGFEFMRYLRPLLVPSGS